jgi:hypothetical protein
MIDKYKQLLEEVLDEVMLNEVEVEGEDDDGGVVDEKEHIVLYTENPYEVIEKNVEKQYYQVIGNEIITITRGRGVCCLCGGLTDVLYTDNTYNSNIPIQICKPCIDSIMK